MENEKAELPVAGTQPTPEERELLLAQFFPQGTPQVEGTPEPPKVEEIAEKMLTVDPVTNQWIRASSKDYLVQALRPYFPPASQTPQISADEIRHLVDCVHIGCNGSVAAHEGFGHPACIACKVGLKLAATPASTARTDGWAKCG